VRAQSLPQFAASDALIQVISINPNQQHSAIDYIHRNGASALIRLSWLKVIPCERHPVKIERHYGFCACC
jgi:hypothetical protein